MAEATSWAQVAQAESARRSNGDIVNLKLVSGNEYTVRFVGDPVRFFKYFVSGKSAVSEFGDASCIIFRKYNVEPSTRYAVNVIDRSDNKLKILEIPPSVLKPVIAWWKRRDKEPGGENGCDFSIAITGQKKNTRYEVLPLDITPFTAEEKTLTEKAYDLKKLYKATPQDQIEAKLGFTAPSSQSNQSNQPNQQTTQVSSPSVADAAKASGWSEPPF